MRWMTAALLVLLLGGVAHANLPFDSGRPVRTTAILDVERVGPDGEPWTFFVAGSGLRRQTAFSIYFLSDPWLPVREYDLARAWPDNRSGTHVIAVRTAVVGTIETQAGGRVAVFDRDPVKHYTQRTHGDRLHDVLSQWAAARPEDVAVSRIRIGGRSQAKDGDPTREIRERYRVLEIRAGVVQLERTHQAFLDKDGKPLTAAQVEQARREKKSAYLLLAIAGLSGLGFVVLRRRRAPAISGA